MSDRLFRLKAGYQQYAWGKVGSTSAVAKYAKNADPSTLIEEDKPYAELWMGTHHKVPSCNIETSEPLTDLIAAHPEKMLGSGIVEKFNSKSELPFLFKVLSIQDVLSIQAHPDKALAKQLHLNDPKNYPDSNHKPEMAIAVTEFEGFCGFKPLDEIADELNRIPEFRTVVTDEVVDSFINGINLNAAPNSSEDESNRKLLQAVFSKVMNASNDVITSCARALVERARTSPSDFNKKTLPDLILRLNAQFPDDIGLFCGCLMLNHCFLKPGEAIFLKAKDPHAYISGDIIECMAASDNVVRAGFTGKFKDVENLVNMLTYTYDSVEKQKMKAEEFKRSSGDGESKLYNPPIEEFAVLETKFKNKIGTRRFEGLQGPSIIITTEGNGYIEHGNTKLKCESGYVFFVAPDTPIELIAENHEFTTYRAFVEPK
ncbi:HDR002Cp [Eremothecium sinecaudum]|uniref:Mannose-6-phosphate isomerase n=1 Tax=Eremothecium sinecaudum TaxID=45286 RepID=A0A120K283_9SACH|nr:HDR002Cp [Eremothecium sinecaudum]AMD20745.1 HDR002Cp [Eremothecium sinecaudum]